MHKHRMIKCYHLDKKTDEEIHGILDEEFIDKYHSKNMMKGYNNFTAIMNTDNQKTEEKLNILKENESLYHHIVPVMRILLIIINTVIIIMHKR